MNAARTIQYIARDEDALRNGSYYRREAKNLNASHYMNGDYMGPAAVSDIPADLRQFTKAEAKPLLPKCCR